MENKGNGKSWFSIAFNLIANIAENIRYSVEKSMQQQKKVVMKKAVALFLLIVGFLYLLGGITKFINMYAGNNWAGEIIMGVIAGIIGIAMLGNNNHY